MFNEAFALPSRCASRLDCDTKWLMTSSRMTRCQNYDPDVVVTEEFDCFFCCSQDDCNAPAKPARDSLYANPALDLTSLTSLAPPSSSATGAPTSAPSSAAAFSETTTSFASVSAKGTADPSFGSTVRPS